MEYCQTTKRRAYGMSCVARIDSGLGARTKAMGEFLKYMISPEASNAEGPLPGPGRAAWMRAVKTLFWIAMATAAGVVPAALCN